MENSIDLTFCHDYASFMLNEHTSLIHQPAIHQIVYEYQSFWMVSLSINVSPNKTPNASPCRPSITSTMSKRQQMQTCPNQPNLPPIILTNRSTTLSSAP